jgi:hypothetical protein
MSSRIQRALAPTALLLALSCARRETAPVAIRNPEYLVVRTIVHEADAEHGIRVELPYAGAGYGYASTEPLFDLTAVDVSGANFAGGRTSLAGEATLWLPLTAEGRRRLDDWSSRNPGDRLGIFLDGRLVAAPQVKTAIGGGIPLRVASKSEGDAVLARLRNGGAPP